MTPEEAALMLAALGFKRDTRIYLAGAEFFGGHSRTITLVSLYPNLVTKEDLLSQKEIEPFIKSSSQVSKESPILFVLFTPIFKLILKTYTNFFHLLVGGS